MAISEFEIKRIEKIVGKFVESIRPTPEKRGQLDISFKIYGQSFEIVETRPQWDDPRKRIEGSIAKATYVKSAKKWKLDWKRADMNWYSYEPFRESKSLEEILEVIRKDQYGCFWG
jgi:DUF3024 family protein